MAGKTPLSEGERVERVARAICAARFAPRRLSVWDAMIERRRERYREMARAALRVADATCTD